MVILYSAEIKNKEDQSCLKRLQLAKKKIAAMYSPSHPDGYGQPHRINSDLNYIPDPRHGPAASLGLCSAVAGLFLWSKKDLVTAASPA